MIRMEGLFKFLIASKIIQISIAVSMVIMALSFGGSLFVQAKNGCFTKIVSTIAEEVIEVKE